MNLGFLSSPLLILIPNDSRLEDRTIQLFKLVSFVLSSGGVPLCDVHVTLGIGKFF